MACNMYTYKTWTNSFTPDKSADVSTDLTQRALLCSPQNAATLLQTREDAEKADVPSARGVYQLTNPDTSVMLIENFAPPPLPPPPPPE
ncbi:hypothetical protein JOB18_013793 [Solea senegalensis]|uniref:Uncharacterized protein n=1 Tax=Solea senegalensis TaxID=28829 RepID=A0AAV6S8Y0_SOLSE|nr:hypothetical protein JOB18_013793 [Solea senegalensis]